jgi:hypothetical protein
MTNFTKVFNDMIEDFGVTNQKLASVMQVHHTTIARWRKEAEGKKIDHPKDPDPIRRFAKHYRFTPDERERLLKAAGFSIGGDVVNPFIVGQPARYDHFFGREKVLKKLFDLWRDFPHTPIQNAAIWGEKRMGKTSLLLHLQDIVTAISEYISLRDDQRKDWLPNPDNYCFIFVDFQNARLSKKKELLEHILEKMKLEKKETLNLELSEENPLREFSKIVSHYLKNPTIILLDEIGTVLKDTSGELDNNFWEGLRALSTTEFNPPRLGFVLSSPEPPEKLSKLANKGSGISSPFFNIFGYTVQLEPFTEQDARALMNSSPKPFSDKDIQFILEKSECNPYLLQRLCRLCLENMLGDQTDNDWQTNAIRIIDGTKNTEELKNDD